jgi:hypothetical protein
MPPAKPNAAPHYPVVEPATPGRAVLSRYLVLLLLAALALYLLPFALIRVPSFERWGGTYFGTALDYGYTTAGQNADIVLFGDSSAMEGLDPIQLSQQLGLKVIDLPNTAGSLPVTDDMVLQRYLQHNRAPRLIVFYFSPWEMDYHAYPSPKLFEGEEMLVRHGSAAQLLAFARQYPQMLPQFPFQLYSTAPHATVVSYLRHEHRAAQLENSRGHMLTQAGDRRLPANCVIPTDLVQRTGVASAETLAARYRTATTQTLIYAAPVPSCVDAGIVAARTYAGGSIAPPQVMDATLFLDDGLYAHPQSTEGVPLATKALGDVLATVLNRR